MLVPHISLLLGDVGSTAFAQSADVQVLINSGNSAAHNDDHAGAIRDYQEAIKLDPSVRDSLLFKLGQQYLWSGQNEPAADLLGEYVKKHPDECSPKSIYALALSWSNRLKLAQQTYRDIEAHCPDLKPDATLGEARILRWRDHNQAAARRYEEVLKSGTAAQQTDAKLGLALTKLALDENRSARDDFRQLLTQPKPDPATYEGLTVADLHLGMNDDAKRDIELGNSAGVHNAQLGDLSEHIKSMSAPVAIPLFTFFRDGDGTTYVAGEARGSFGRFPRTHAEAFAGASNLDLNSVSIAGHWGGAAVEHRFNETLAVRTEGKFTQYDEAHFNPFTGEADAVITPTDSTRIDLSTARITIWDNQAALFHHLIGTFGSLGVDQRLTRADRLTLAFDATGWDWDQAGSGNHRLRYRFIPSHTFDGVPRLTISLPVLYQTYNQGFNFGLFSPSSYIELAPAADVRFRRARVWSFDFYGRLGGQKEANLNWKALGTFQARVERDLKNGWGLSAMFIHSSSNVASSSGFSRTTVTFSLLRQF